MRLPTWSEGTSDCRISGSSDVFSARQAPASAVRIEQDDCSVRGQGRHWSPFDRQLTERDRRLVARGIGRRGVAAGAAEKANARPLGVERRLRSRG
jgi:hypothetical protein